MNNLNSYFPYLLPCHNTFTDETNPPRGKTNISELSIMYLVFSKIRTKYSECIYKSDSMHE